MDIRLAFDIDSDFILFYFWERFISESVNVVVYNTGVHLDTRQLTSATT